MHKTQPLSAEINPSATLRIYENCLLAWSQFHNSSSVNRSQWYTQLCS